MRTGWGSLESGAGRASPRAGHPFFGGAPLLIAHRGGARLAPENTMPAFRSAVDDWDADVLEMDVHLTADGRIVVLHDETVDRTTDGTGPVRAIEWSRLARLDAGFRFVDRTGEPSARGRGIRIPLFEEVLEAFPRVRFIVEPKVAEAAEPLVRAIRAAGAEHRVLIGAESEATRGAARGYHGPWGASRRQVLAFWLLHRLPGVGRWHVPAADAFQVPECDGRLRVVTPAFVRAAHAVNMPVHVWTVDDPADMRRLLDWGVDGIQTDRPDILARVLTDVVDRPEAPGAAP